MVEPAEVAWYWVVSRSLLDSRVWQPLSSTGDESSLLYAGTLRAVKGWVQEQVDMREHRWVKSEGEWLLMRNDHG